MSSFVFICTVAAICLSLFVGARRGEARRVLVSGIASIVYLLALWVPGVLQANGVLTSKLVASGLLSRIQHTELSDLAWRWSLELILIVVGERMGWWFAARGRPAGSLRTESHDGALVIARAFDRRVAIVLLFIGSVALVIFPSGDGSIRAVGGEGAISLVKSTLVLGLALVVYRNFFESIKFRIAFALGLVVLISANVRSPILVIGVAYLLSLVNSKIKFTVIRVSILSVAVVAFAVLAAVMSSLRGARWRDGAGSFGSALSGTLDSPWESIYGAGLDTLDGYRIVSRFDSSVGSNWADPLTIFTTLVPRAIWPEKPVDLTVEFSSQFLGYGASGQFLSPVGYLRLVAGDYPAALFLLPLVVALLAACICRSSGKFEEVVVIVVTIRFLIGGAAFDFYYGLTLLLAYWTVRGLLRVLSAPVVPVEARRREILE